MKGSRRCGRRVFLNDAIDPVIPLNKGQAYQFELCHMRFVGCTRQLIDVWRCQKD